MLGRIPKICRVGKAKRAHLSRIDAQVNPLISRKSRGHGAFAPLPTLRLAIPSCVLEYEKLGPTLKREY
jgi:hypothetical protein